jgi:hypothetical protein
MIYLVHLSQKPHAVILIQVFLHRNSNTEVNMRKSLTCDNTDLKASPGVLIHATLATSCATIRVAKTQHPTKQTLPACGKPRQGKRSPVSSCSPTLRLGATGNPWPGLHRSLARMNHPTSRDDRTPCGGGAPDDVERQGRPMRLAKSPG